MAAQTLTAGQVTNYDGPTLMLGLNNGEAITVNGGSLTVDADVRWNQNAAVFGSITVSGSLGGTLLFDARNAWQLSFTASTGLVPAQLALGSNTVTGATSGATGELTRVWGSGLEPLAADGAMPTTGWLKLRTKSGIFQANETVTLPGGATVTITDAGRQSWIHIVGVEAGTLTIPRLADVKLRGAWYELGTTSGAADQTFQYPVADMCPCIWVEKYPDAFAAEAEAGLEKWLNAGGRWGTATSFVAQDVRGKYFGQVATTGVITLAQRATNACGFLPDADLKVFVPNLIASNSTSADWNLNTCNATLSSRYKPSTISSGAVDIDLASINWWLNMSTAYGISITNTAILDQFDIANTTTRPYLANIGVGSSSSAAYAGLNFSAVTDGVDLLSYRATRQIQGPALSISDSFDVVLDDVQCETFGNTNAVNRSGTSVTAASFSRLGGLTANKLKLLGAKCTLQYVEGMYLKDTEYADNLYGVTQAAQTMDILTISRSTNILADGVSAFGGLQNVHPFGFVMNIASSCADAEIRNVGTPSAPYAGDSTVNHVSGVLYAIGSKNARARRCYLSTNRLAVVTSNNTHKGLYLDNVWGNPSQSQTLTASGMTAKGCRWLHSGTGVTSIFGSHWADNFASATVGYISVSANEPITETADQVSLSVGASGGFNAAGGVQLPNIGDTVTWTMPYFAIGYTGFGNSGPVVAGTQTQNIALEFQVDVGAGWSEWAALTLANIFASPSIDPALGVKLKIRATTTVANVANALNNIRIPLVTDAVNQTLQYEMADVTSVTFDGVPAGSEIRVSHNGEDLAGVESCVANQELTWPAYTVGDPRNIVRVLIINMGYKIKDFTYTSKIGAQSIPATLEKDKWAYNPA